MYYLRIGHSCSTIPRDQLHAGQASRAFSDERLAPNSYNARVHCTFCISNGYLRKQDWSFDSLAPTLVFKGPGSAEISVKKWNELRSSFDSHGHFDEVIKTLPQLDGAKKLGMTAHGSVGTTGT